MAGWSLGLLLGVGALAGLAYLVGHGRPYGLSPALDDIAYAATRPAPALTIAFLVLTELAWCIRRLALEWLAWRPGKIEVARFSAATELSPAEVDQHTLTFRRRLAELRLQTPSGVPGAALQGDFLDVLGAGGADSRNLLGSLVSLVRAAKPTHAYEVNGVLLAREAPQPYGVTVQVMCLPTRARVPVTVWDRSWEAAARRAADAATSAILPQTRLCRDQWVTWRRSLMPHGLLHAYEQGASFEQDRRYDEALAAYYEALEHDPMNLAIRLQVGKLQEKLGLYLDAFATYEGIRRVMQPGNERVPRRLYRHAAWRQRNEALLAAEYRRIVLMGGAELAKQWLRSHAGRSTPTERDRHRAALRDQLRPGLAEELEQAAERHDHASSLPLLKRARRAGDLEIDELLDPDGPVADAEERERYLQLREVLALAAIDAVPRLRRRVRVTRHRSLEPPVVKLTRLCVEERLDWLRSQLDPENPRWPPSDEHIRERVEHVEGRTPFLDWHEHYNAACAYAVPLLDDQLDDGTRDRLARLAVERLERATASADGAFVATRRDWLVSEDPDLDGLRALPPFKRFEAMYFPAASAAAVRPRDVQRLESARYVHSLLVATARHWKREWHRRGRVLGRRPDTHLLLRWWQDEYEAWQLVRNVAVHRRHWEARLRLVKRMAEWSDEYGLEPLAVPFPRYEEQPLPHRDDFDACDVEVGLADDRLDRLAAELPEPPNQAGAPAMLEHLSNWHARLRQLDLSGAEPRRYFLAKLCDCHAGLWQLIGEWLSSDGRQHDPAVQRDIDNRAADRFAAQVDDARRLWCTAYDWWRPRRGAGDVLARAPERRRGAGTRARLDGRRLVARPADAGGRGGARDQRDGWGRLGGARQPVASSALGSPHVVRSEVVGLPADGPVGVVRARVSGAVQRGSARVSVLDFGGADVSVPLRFGDPVLIDGSESATVQSAALVGPRARSVWCGSTGRSSR